MTQFRVELGGDVSDDTVKALGAALKALGYSWATEADKALTCLRPAMVLARDDGRLFCVHGDTTVGTDIFPLANVEKIIVEAGKRFAEAKMMEAKAPEHPRFWMVYREKGGCPSCRHETLEAAHKEASRLAEKEPGVTFYLLQAVGGVMAKVAPVSDIVIVEGSS